MFARILLAASAALAATAAVAQPATPPAMPDAAAQKAAINRLAMFDGTWRGEATVSMPGSPPRKLTHTERVGPMLGGTLKVIEGKSYTPAGADGGFNAFAVISYDDQAKAYAFRAYAQGHASTFPMTVNADGYDWSMPAGPGGTIHYKAVVAGGRWHEEGWYERGGQRVAQVFVMDLKRIGDTAWPAADAVQPK